MNTNTQILAYNVSTKRTSLCCSAWINFNKCSTGPFRLVAQIIEELCPCCIVYEFIQTFEAVKHLTRLKFLNKNKAESIHDFSAEFMLKVRTLVGNLFMQFRQRPVCSLAFLFRMLLLKVGELIFALFKIFGIVNNFAVRCCGKRFNAYINSNFLIGCRQNNSRGISTGESGIEPSVLSLDRDGFYRAFNIPMQFNPDTADVLDIEPSVLKPNSITIGGKGNQIEAVSVFEAWESRIVATFNAPKKCLECLIQTSQNILRGGIIQIKNVFQLKFLGLVGKKTILKRFFHFAFFKYTSIALRISSATFNPVLSARFFNRTICWLVMCIFTRFIQLIYTLYFNLSIIILKKEKGSAFLCQLKQVVPCA